VAGLLQRAAGERRRVLDVLDAGDRPAGERLAVHDAGVEREPAEPVGQAAEPDRGADRVVVLDRLRPRQGRVQGRLALGELLEGGLGGQLAERPGGDHDGLGHDGSGTGTSARRYGVVYPDGGGSATASRKTEPAGVLSWHARRLWLNGDEDESPAPASPATVPAVRTASRPEVRGMSRLRY